MTQNNTTQFSSCFCHASKSFRDKLRILHLHHGNPTAMAPRVVIGRGRTCQNTTSSKRQEQVFPPVAIALHPHVGRGKLIPSASCSILILAIDFDGITLDTGKYHKATIFSSVTNQLHLQSCTRRPKHGYADVSFDASLAQHHV